MNFKWIMRDQINNLKINTPYILNEDVSAGPGTHWTVIYVHPPHVLFYDPLGKGPRSKSILPALKTFANKNKLKVHMAPVKTQLNPTWLCGNFSLHIASILRKYKPKTIKQFDELIIKEYGKTPDLNDAKKITGWSITNNILTPN